MSKPASRSSMARLRVSRVDRAPSTLVQRQGEPSNGDAYQGNQPESGATGGVLSQNIIIMAIIIIVFVVAVCVYLALRICRARDADPRYLPKPLKKLWTKWDVSHHSSTKYSRTGEAAADEHFRRRTHMRSMQDQRDDARPDAEANHRLADAGAVPPLGSNSYHTNNTSTHTIAADAAAAGVDRNTSVRSVMTLPAYRPTATDTERVVGRAGERAGIDTVVEPPPTAAADEALREAEMAALYRIRVARRRADAERAAHREERRAARARRDGRALAALRERARGAAQRAQLEVGTLRERHDAVRQSRARAVSSVAYAAVGLVRADGTRLRASSCESERAGLLSDAGSVAPSARESSRRQSSALRPQSVLSIDTLGSHDGGGGGGGSGSPSGSSGRPEGRGRTSSGGQLSESYGMAAVPRAGSAMSQRAGSSPEPIESAEAAMGDSGVPTLSPPGYDDVSLAELTPAASQQSGASGQSSPYNEPPPEYESPTQMRQNRLSARMADLAAGQQQQQQQQQQHPSTPEAQAGPSYTRTNARGVDGFPQLPSLRLDGLPQIVIEPSTAITPSHDHIDEEASHLEWRAD